MPNLVNQLLLKNYLAHFKAVESFVSVGTTGMDVKTVNLLRAQIAQGKMRMLFVKNRIAALALRELGKTDISALCDGQTAFVDGEDPVTVARFLSEFQKDNAQLKLHGALVENAVINGKQVAELAKSPTKTELKGMLAGQILGPARGVPAVVLGPGRILAGQLKALVEKLEKGAPAEAPAAAAS